MFFSRTSYCYCWTFPRQARLLARLDLSGCRPEPERFQELAAYGLRGRRNLMILLFFFFLDIVTPCYLLVYFHVLRHVPSVGIITPCYHWVILYPRSATGQHGRVYVVITVGYITLWYDAPFCCFAAGINPNDYNAFRRIHALQDENLFHSNPPKWLKKSWKLRTTTRCR